MPGITFIYANRNREVKRIIRSLDSLINQRNNDGFEVVLVDYGSESGLVQELQKELGVYDFVNFYSLNVQQLLWNKSKALNYGILKSKSDQIFIADVDLIFHPDTIDHLLELANKKSFNLFSLHYLSETESKKLEKKFDFSNLEPERSGTVNGMVLAPKNAFLEINGFDEFFHFYGGEDVDLFDRMELAGYNRINNNDLKLFYHNWHKSFSGSEDKLITRNPRMENIMRINERHYNMNKELNLIQPKRQSRIGRIIRESRSNLLNKPDHEFKLPNIKANVEHFLFEELVFLTGIIKVVIYEDPYYFSLKHKIKKKLGKESQIYISLKEVNDMVLKKILFEYRDDNYSFKIAEDLKSIEFIIELN